MCVCGYVCVREIGIGPNITIQNGDVSKLLRPRLLNKVEIKIGQKQKEIKDYYDLNAEKLNINLFNYNDILTYVIFLVYKYS